MTTRRDFNSIVYRDTLFSMIQGLVLLMGIMVLLISAKAIAAMQAALPPGNLSVHIDWPSGNNDVDLWVDGPGQAKPVGFSNKSGRVWNLLRDDLGSSGYDASNANYEDAVTRGVVPGEYVINVFCYRCDSVPQEVYVEITVNTGDPHSSAPLKRLLQTTISLVRNHQERTVIRFRLKADGTIEPGSETTVFKSLVGGKG